MNRPHLTNLLAAPDHIQHVMERACAAMGWPFAGCCVRCGTALAEMVVDTCGLRCLNQAACDRRAEMREAALRGAPVQIPMGEVA
jgi:hypothetical protein